MEDETRKLLTASLRELLADTERDAAAGLADLGWDEVLAEDEAAATILLFTEQGQALATSSAVEDVTLGALRAAGVAVPDDVGVLFPSTDPDPAAGKAAGIAVRDPAGRRLVVPAGLPSARQLRLVRLRQVQLRPVTVGDDATVARVSGVDETLRWWSVGGPAFGGEGGASDVLADGPSAAAAWRAAWSAAARAVAAELCGLSAAMLDLAVAHVRDRRQFGRPLGSFQAVRQDLADGLVHLTAAREAVEAAWEGAGDQDSEWISRSAWALAVNAHAVTARHAMQVCGAMGLSWEHSLHRYVRRGMALEALLGSGRSTTTSLGADLLASDRPLPRVLTL